MIDPKTLKVGDVVWVASLWTRWPMANCVNRFDAERVVALPSDLFPMFATEAEARAWCRDDELRKAQGRVESAKAQLAKLEALAAEEKAREVSP